MLLRNADPYFASLLGLGWSLWAPTPGIICFDGSGIPTQYSLFSSIGSYNLKTLMSRLASTDSACYTSFRSDNANVYGVVFGSGREEVTPGSYCLSGGLLTGITSNNTVFSQSSNVTDEDACVTGVYTITNSTEEAITIGEIGLVNTCQTIDPSTSKYVYCTFLMEHTLLAEPLTIPAGSVGRVNYTIRMKHPVPAAASEES